jgi:hypothetical protein
MIQELLFSARDVLYCERSVVLFLCQLKQYSLITRPRFTVAPPSAASRQPQQPEQQGQQNRLEIVSLYVISGNHNETGLELRTGHTFVRKAFFKYVVHSSL